MFDAFTDPFPLPARRSALYDPPASFSQAQSRFHLEGSSHSMMPQLRHAVAACFDEILDSQDTLCSPSSTVTDVSLAYAQYDGPAPGGQFGSPWTTTASSTVDRQDSAPGNEEYNQAHLSGDMQSPLSVKSPTLESMPLPEALTPLKGTRKKSSKPSFVDHLFEYALSCIHTTLY